jgi:predicted CoA-binding protein
MAGYKETPRQKMISMMYLVLTALLALNVAKQILDAFVVVNESMEATNENFSQKINQTYAKFNEQYALNPEKVGKYWEKAKQVKNLSKSINNYIDTLKVTVIAKTEKIPHSVADTIKLIDMYFWNQPKSFSCFDNSLGLLNREIAFFTKSIHVICKVFFCYQGQHFINNQINIGILIVFVFNRKSMCS